LFRRTSSCALKPRRLAIALHVSSACATYCPSAGRRPSVDGHEPRLAMTRLNGQGDKIIAERPVDESRH
jgi:hypothetical protein